MGNSPAVSPARTPSIRNALESKLVFVRRIGYLLLLFPVAPFSLGQPAAGSTPPLTPSEAQALVDRALGNELKAAQDRSHPMRFELRQSSPRLTTTKDIFETKDGEVARLLAVGDKPLSPADEQKEQARLSDLLANPGRQRHRKQAEDDDDNRALIVLRALPAAFLFEYQGIADGPTGPVERFAFRPNPGFSPPDLETEVLSAMTGEILVDPVHERVTRLEGHLQRDVDFGWGILGRLNKGGWIAIDQAEVGGGEWRYVHFKMQMSGRVVFKTRVFDTTEDESLFAPLPAGLSYQQAIAMMREEAK